MKHLRLEKQCRQLIVRVTESRLVGDALVAELGDELMEATEQARSFGQLIIDLRCVKLTSSGAIGKLVLLYKKTKLDGVRFTLWNVPPHVMEIFVATKLNLVFEITVEHEVRAADPFRFVPELFEMRNQVLAALENADFCCWRDFGAVSPCHDIHGIEVTGISCEPDADEIMELLCTMFPTWPFKRTYGDCGVDPAVGTWCVQIHRDEYRQNETNMD